jgi:hypothetical protein
MGLISGGGAGMSKAELEDMIDGIFAPLGSHSRHPDHPDAKMIGDARTGSIMVEQAWLELYQLVESLLSM